MENIFKDKLTGYSEQPPAHVWEKIVEKRSPRHIWWNHIRLNLARYAALSLVATLALIWGIMNLPASKEVSQQNNLPVKGIEIQSSDKSNLTAATHDDQSIQNSAQLPQIDNKNYGAQNVKSSSNNSHNSLSKVQKQANQQNQIKRGIIDNEQQKIAHEIQNGVPKSDEIGMSPKNEEDQNSDNKKEIEKEDKVADITVQTPTTIDAQNIIDDEAKKGKKRNDNQDISPLKSWAIEILYGPYWGNIQLQGSNAILKEIRNSSETMIAGSMAGLRVSRHFGNHWEMSAGAYIISRKEQVKYEVNTSYQRMNLKETMVTVYHPVLPPVVKKVTDTSYTEVKGTEMRSRNNQYTTVSVPLIFRYNYYLNRWSFYGSAGVLADIHTYRNAQVLNEKGDFIQSSQVFDNKINSRMYGAVGLKYKTGQHWSILAEPAITIGLSNQAKSNYSLKQSERGYGIQAGIRYDF